MASNGGGDVLVPDAPHTDVIVPSVETPEPSKPKKRTPKGESVVKKRPRAPSEEGAAPAPPKKKVPKKSATQTSPAAAAKPRTKKAPLKVKEKKKTTTPTAALPDSGGDDDDDGGGGGGDSDWEPTTATSNGEERTKTKTNSAPAAGAADVPRRPPRRRTTPTTTTTPVSSRLLAPPDVQTRANVLAIINSPRRQLNDEVFDVFAPLITSKYRNNYMGAAAGGGGGDKEETGKRSDMIIFTPLRLQTVLSDYYHHHHHRHSSSTDDTPANPDAVFSKLGTTRDAVEKADLLVAIIHGPVTEENAANMRLYGPLGMAGGGEDASASAASAAPQPPATVNFHWSVLVYSRANNMAYHYDSNFPMNMERCVEVHGVLRATGVLPKDAYEVANPAFFPRQKEMWECGYYVLIALLIISDNAQPTPLSDIDIDTYHLFFNTIHNEKECLIRDRLRSMLLYSWI